MSAVINKQMPPPVDKPTRLNLAIGISFYIKLFLVEPEKNYFLNHSQYFTVSINKSKQRVYICRSLIRPPSVEIHLEDTLPLQNLSVLPGKEIQLFGCHLAVLKTKCNSSAQ